MNPIPEARPPDYNDSGELRVDYLKRLRDQYGILVIEPGPRDIQIDIDSEEAYNRYLELRSMLDDSETWVNIDQTVIRQSRSNSPFHFHITITFDREITTWERIAWQAALGSDAKRELFSCIRHRENEIAPVCFFETTETMKAMVSFDDSPF